MFEIFTASFFGFNVVPSVLLALALLYWLTVVIGGIEHNILDAHFDFHADLDTDVDAEGIAHGILVFLNFRDVPVMLLFSFITLFWWAIAIGLQLSFDLTVFLSGIIQIPAIILAAFIAKAITSPFRKFFRELKGFSQPVQIVNKACTLITDVQPGRIGQAEIERDGAPILINVKSVDGTIIHKGDDAFVVHFDKEKDLYEIKLTKDILHVEDSNGGSR
ncbi:MAG: hypothetical protein ACM31E_06130 [Fibrobacterota bacterium]